MKKTYHLCISAGDEVMFRDLEDYHRGFNCFALALYKTGSTGLAESIMSTHSHSLVQTTDPKAFMFNFRNPYSKYFNRKYGRTGKLGEDIHFTLEVVGHHHTGRCKLYAQTGRSSRSCAYAIRIPTLLGKRHIQNRDGKVLQRSATAGKVLRQISRPSRRMVRQLQDDCQRCIYPRKRIGHSSNGRQIRYRKGFQLLHDKEIVGRMGVRTTERQRHSSSCQSAYNRTRGQYARDRTDARV